jgi:hypothetical protein
MRVPFGRWSPVFLAAVGFTSIALEAQKGPAVADVLKAGGDYLVQYAQKISGVAAEEQYVQSDVSTGQMGVPKRLTSDYVLYGSTDGQVTGFRDVFAIDSKPVRPREDRLAALFKHPTPEVGQQARQWTDESVRYYLNPNLQSLDQPTLALEYLRKENQERSTFKIENVKNSGGAQIATLKFTEHPGSHVIPSNDDTTAVGRFWIDVATGTVRQTELGVTGRNSSVRVSVKYAEQAPLGLWLPSEMYQQFEISGHGSTATSNMGSGGGYNAHESLEGRATYSKYRTVTTPAGALDDRR